MDNQRKHTRYICADSGRLRLSVRPEFRGRRAILLDVSAGGIGFLLGDALEPGTTIAFEVKAADGVDAMTRLARVRHCRPHPVPEDAPWLPPAPVFSRLFRSLFGVKPAQQGSAWLIGCEFDRSLTDEDIQRFLAALKADAGES